MSIFKKIGKVLTAPLHAVGHALGTSKIPLLSNVGSAAEHVSDAFSGKGAFLRDIGKAGKDVAPVAALVPGVGPLVAGGLGAGGELLDKGRKAKLSDVVMRGAIPAAEAALLGGQGFKGAGGALDKVKGLISSKPGQAVLNYVKKHPLDAAQIALAGVSTVQGAQAAGKADSLRSDALAGINPNPAIDFRISPDEANPYKKKRMQSLASMTGGY